MSSHIIRVLLCGLVDIFPTNTTCENQSNDTAASSDTSNSSSIQAVPDTDIDTGLQLLPPAVIVQQKSRIPSLNSVPSNTSIRRKILKGQASQCVLKPVCPITSALDKPKKRTSITRSDIRNINKRPVLSSTSTSTSSDSATQKRDIYNHTLVGSILESTVTLDRTLSNLSNVTTESTYLHFEIDTTPDIRHGF